MASTGPAAAGYVGGMVAANGQPAAGPGGLAAALHAAGPDPGLAGPLALFGRFAGAWDIEWRGEDQDGNPATMRGDLHFGWVLGGRAIQDVWRVPASGAAPPGLRPFHGTTLRFYDPGLGAWRSTWIDPLNARVRRFTGRPEGADIILDGLDDDPAERWCFRDIAPGAVPESFRWTGEVSTDGRRTWRLDEEMLIRRR
jgi:hypothetical protein